MLLSIQILYKELPQKNKEGLFELLRTKSRVLTIPPHQANSPMPYEEYLATVLNQKTMEFTHQLLLSASVEEIHSISHSWLP